jgi:hypothetical protein
MSKIKTFREKTAHLANLSLSLVSKDEFLLFSTVHDLHAINAVALPRGVLEKERYLELLIVEFEELLKHRRECESLLCGIRKDFSELQERNNCSNDI